MRALASPLVVVSACLGLVTSPARAAPQTKKPAQFAANKAKKGDASKGPTLIDKPNRIGKFPPTVPRLDPDAPVQSAMKFAFPDVTDARAQQQAEQRVQGMESELRACYELGYSSTPPVAPAATITLSFSLERGSPLWIHVKESQGLNDAINLCLADAVSRMTDLFPADLWLGNAQRITLEFTRVDPNRKPPQVALEGY